MERSPGPKIRGVGRAEAAFGSHPATANAEAMCLDWPKSRLGRWSGATQQAWTDVACTLAATPLSGSVQQPPCSGKSW